MQRARCPGSARPLCAQIAPIVPPRPEESPRRCQTTGLICAANGCAERGPWDSLSFAAQSSFFLFCLCTDLGRRARCAAFSRAPRSLPGPACRVLPGCRGKIGRRDIAVRSIRALPETLLASVPAENSPKRGPEGVVFTSRPPTQGSKRGEKRPKRLRHLCNTAEDKKEPVART